MIPMVTISLSAVTSSFVFFKTLSSRRKDLRTEMAETKEGVVQHVVITKFKEGVPPEKVDELIKEYANLVSLIEPMKDFHWGTDLSIENLHQGFTHVFVSTFESAEGVAEYVTHPIHVEFGNKFLTSLEKVLVIDYKPTFLKH